MVIMILDNTDLYAKIQALSNELREAGEARWSSELNDALVISSVPGEILGETRLRLQKLRACQIPSVLGLKWRVEEALSYLDGILGSDT